MRDHYEVIGISSHGQLLNEIEGREGIRTIGVNMTRKITPWKDLKGLWHLYTIFKREKPLIVHTHSPKAGLLGMLAAKLALVPIRMHTVAGMPLLEVKGIRRLVLNKIEVLTYRCATKVYPNSFKLCQDILDANFCKKSKLKVIANGSSNGIDTSFFDPSLFSVAQIRKIRSDLGIAEHDIVLLFVGRIVHPKGINELVNAFIKARALVSKLKLLLVGPFDNDKDCLDTATKSKIQENSEILTTGFQEDVRPYFAASDIFVFPSHREGFPNVVMQACAMQLPCIVSNINGCNELIEHGKNGLIIAVKDVQMLVNAIVQLASDKPIREKMGGSSRARITSLYDQQLVFHELLKEYGMLSSELNSHT